MRSFLDPPINVNEGTVLLRNIHLVLVRPDRSKRHQFFCKPQSIYKDFWLIEELKEWVCRDEVPGVTLREILEWEGHIEIYRLNNHQVFDFIEELVKDGQLILYDTHDFNAAEKEKEEENRQATHLSLPSALGTQETIAETPAIPKATDSPQPRVINTPDTTAEAQESFKRDLALDISQMVLDMAGIVDPTPISDGASALIALSRGQWWDAAISAVSIIPYVGDLAKLGKLPGYAKSIEKITKIAKTDATWANELQPVLENLKPFLDKVVETGASTLPKSALEAFNGMKKEVDDFLMYNTGMGGVDTATNGVVPSGKQSGSRAKSSSSNQGASEPTPKKEPSKKQAEDPSNTNVSPEMEQKILYGERKPGSNRLIGAHSPKVSNSNPDFVVETLVIDADGTKKVKLVKQYPDGNVSNIKQSTLYPDDWTDADIIDATKKVGDEVPYISRIHDRATFHKKEVNGVEIEVIKDGNDVTSSYPTGG